MKKYARGVALPTLLAAALALASCGGSGAGGDDMRGMEHGSGSTQGETTGGMAGMNHEGMASGEMAREMLYDENGEYSDVRFVDSMTPHHEGAVEMTEVALENAEHEEIKDLAGDIISAQTAEIEILGEIRAELDAGPKMEVGDEDMQMMGMVDSRELAPAALRPGVHGRHDPAPRVGGRDGERRPRREREPEDKDPRRGHRWRPEAGDRPDGELVREVVPGELGRAPRART